VYVKPEFGFETNSLNFGRIPKGESATRTAVLLLKDPTWYDQVEIETETEFIDAKILEANSTDKTRMEIEVTSKPGIPAGRLDDRVTARLRDDSQTPTTLRVIATIVGNVEVQPRSIHFIIDTSQAEPDIPIREVKVVGTNEDVRFNLLSVEDLNDLLTLNTDTLIAGKQYRILAKPNENSENLNRIQSGIVKIKTDDPEQPELEFSYRIIIR
jgi:hypothetical protein